MTSARAWPGQPAFAHRGFYLHAGWEYAYPFAVRTWTRSDYDSMFALLARLGFDTVMLWPMMESVPPPLSTRDAEDLARFREVIGDAQQQGLACWLTQCANLTTRPEIASQPLAKRHLMPFAQPVRLDNPMQRDPYLAHRAALQKIVNNADAYVTIDGDPGGYPGAAPVDFLRVLEADHDTIARIGTHAKRQKIVPWLWAGWGADWEKNGVWKEPLEPLTAPVLLELKRGMRGPWEILCGRSHREGWANGRTNIELAERANLIDRSVLLFYEVVEFEPTPPAAVIQFDLIRGAMRQELKHARTCRGCFANAQQPVMVLPNLYLFARAAWDPDYLDEPDGRVLDDCSEFFGGPSALLSPAWQCLRLPLHEIPADLPERLRETELNSEASGHIPGGPRLYLELLAKLVESRLRVLKACESPACVPARLADAIAGAVDWWNVHRWAFDGAGPAEFRWSYTPVALSEPLKIWLKKQSSDASVLASHTAKELSARGILHEDDAHERVEELLEIQQ